MDEEFKRWGDDVVQAMMEQHNRGIGYKDIARELSRQFPDQYTICAVSAKISIICGPRKRDKKPAKPIAPPWTKEQSDDALSLWRDGHSGGQIARMLSVKYGRDWTRSAVIGRIHRMNAAEDRDQKRLSRKQKITRSKGRPKKTPLFTGTKKRIEPPKVYKPTNREHSAYVASLVGTKHVVHDDPARELGPHDCRMPSGTFETDKSFCGKPAMPGSSYCQPCHKVVFTKTVEDQKNSRQFSGKPLLMTHKSALVKA